MFPAAARLKVKPSTAPLLLSASRMDEGVLRKTHRPFESLRSVCVCRGSRGWGWGGTGSTSERRDGEAEGRWLDVARAKSAVGKGRALTRGFSTLGCQGSEASSLRCSTSSCKLQGFFHVTSAFVFYGRGPEERLLLSPAARRIFSPAHTAAAASRAGRRTCTVCRGN